MRKQQIIDRLNAGEKIEVVSYCKFKNNKVVRGSFYQYTLRKNVNDNGGDRITGKQFDAIRDKLTISYRGVSSTVYGIKKEDLFLADEKAK